MKGILVFSLVAAYIALKSSVVLATELDPNEVRPIVSFSAFVQKVSQCMDELDEHEICPGALGQYWWSTMQFLDNSCTREGNSSSNCSRTPNELRAQYIRMLGRDNVPAEEITHQFFRPGNESQVEYNERLTRWQAREISSISPGDVLHFDSRRCQIPGERNHDMVVVSIDANYITVLEGIRGDSRPRRRTFPTVELMRNRGENLTEQGYQHLGCLSFRGYTHYESEAEINESLAAIQRPQGLGLVSRPRSVTTVVNRMRHQVGSFYYLGEQGAGPSFSLSTSHE